MQRSISDSWYQLTWDKWMFTVATWGYTLPLLINTVEHHLTPAIGILFFACVMICFVGAAPDFKNADRGWHSFFAEGGIFLLLVWMFVTGQWILASSTIAVIIPLLFIKKVKNNTFWIEVVAYLSMIIASL